MRNPIISALVLIATIAAGVRLGGSSNLPSCSALAAETEGGDRSAEYRSAVAAFKDGRLADALSRFQDVMNNTSGSLSYARPTWFAGRSIVFRVGRLRLGRHLPSWPARLLLGREIGTARCPTGGAARTTCTLLSGRRSVNNSRPGRMRSGFYAKLQSLETGQISSAERGMESYGEGSARFARMLFRKVPLWLRTIKKRGPP